VLTHGKPPGTAEEEAAWQASQATQAAYSTRGRLVVAEQSGHAIQFDQPELVVSTIREVVRQGTAR
jgi:hypothetical protein